MRRNGLTDTLHTSRHSVPAQPTVFCVPPHPFHTHFRPIEGSSPDYLCPEWTDELEAQQGQLYADLLQGNLSCCI